MQLTGATKNEIQAYLDGLDADVVQIVVASDDGIYLIHPENMMEGDECLRGWPYIVASRAKGTLLDNLLDLATC